MGCRVQLRWSTRMSRLQRYVLNPYEKWKMFGEWPWQLTWHLCIVVMATYQVAVNTELHGVTERSMGMHFAKAFYPDNYAQFNGDDAVHPWPHYYIFSWDDLQADMALAKQRYFALPDFALAPMQVAQPVRGNASSDLIAPGRVISSNGVHFPILQMKRYQQPADALMNPNAAFDAKAFHVSTFSLQSNLSDIKNLMLNGGNMTHNAFMSTLYGMTLTLPVQTFTPTKLWIAWTYTQCTQWLIHIKYHFHSKGQVEVLPGYHLQGACDGAWMRKFDSAWQAKWQTRQEHQANRTKARQPTRLPVRRKTALRTPVDSVRSAAPVELGAGRVRPFQLQADEQDSFQGYLTVLVAMAVLLGVAHEITVVSECCSAVALVRQLTRRAIAGQGGPQRRARVLADDAPAQSVSSAPDDARANDLKDAVVAAHDARASHCSFAYCTHQCALLRGWQVAASLGNLCNMAYFVLLAVEFKVDSVAKRVDVKAENVFDSPGHTVAPRLLLGCASALLWLSLLQYLEHFPKYYSFILTLKRAAPRLTVVRQRLP